MCICMYCILCIRVRKGEGGRKGERESTDRTEIMNPTQRLCNIHDILRSTSCIAYSPSSTEISDTITGQTIT